MLQNTLCVIRKSISYCKFLGLVCKLVAYITISSLFIWTLPIAQSTLNSTSLMLSFGLCLNELLNSLLKNLIREERPQQPFHSLSHCLSYEDGVGDGWGMPCSHAQFMAFLYYTSLKTFLSRKQGPLKKNKRMNYFMISLMRIMCVLVCWSRVHLEYHTVQQVLVGCVVGLGSARFYLNTVASFVEGVGFDVIKSFVKRNVRSMLLSTNYLTPLIMIICCHSWSQD